MVRLLAVRMEPGVLKAPEKSWHDSYCGNLRGTQLGMENN